MDFKNLSYNKQCMDEGVVTVYDNGERVICDMFIDEYGDIGFYYKGYEIYFKQIKYLG